MAEAISGPLGIVLAFVWGALWGSFANVVVVRLPQNLSLLRPGSHCFACGKPVAWYDNVPLLSYLLLRGRCRSCSARFSSRYFLIELVSATLSAVLWSRAALAATLQLAMMRYLPEFLLVETLLVLSFIDLEHMILPDKITLPGIAVFFGLGFIYPFSPLWWHRLIGITAGWGVVWAVAEIYFRVAKREGMGLGDAKLLALLGGFLGWQSLLFVLFFGSIQGLLVTVPLRLLRGHKVFGAEIPFGPFLALAAIEYLFVGAWFWGG